MTARERLLRIFRGEVPDRPAVRLWGPEPGQTLLHPAYEPVYRLALERTDLVAMQSSPFDLHWGSAWDKICRTREEPTESEQWVDSITEVATPDGTLRSIYQRSTQDLPGYQKEYLLKEPADIKKALSVPYEPCPFSADAFLASEAALGDRGITMLCLEHAMYGLQQLIGSENFAYWSVECRDLLLEAMSIFAERIREQALRAFEAGIDTVFGWVGPELCIPPLMSPRDFDDFVFRFDQPLIELIHERGARVWVHCHGNMGPVLERFVEMGADVLNPMEPPPIGDLTLAEAFARVGDQMGLEGNIETHELMTATPERLRELVREAIEAGRGRRFILCPTSGYMEWPNPEARYIENYLTFIREGLRAAEAVAAGK